MSHIKESIIKAFIKEDQDGEMAIIQLHTMISACKQLLMLIDEDDDLEPWVSAKITTAADYIDTVRDYMINYYEDDDEYYDDYNLDFDDEEYGE